MLKINIICIGKIKEKYFTDEDYWKEQECRETVLIRYNANIRLPLTMNPEMAEKLLSLVPVSS